MLALSEPSEISSKKEQSLPSSERISMPHGHDVLCERGKMANNHPGNIYYRLLIGEHRRAYVQEKINNSRTIVNAIKSLNPPGRFLRKRGGVWYEVGEKQAIEKASQCLREGAPELRGILKPRRDELSVAQEQTMIMNATPDIPSCNSNIPQIRDNIGPTQSSIETPSMVPAYSKPWSPTAWESPQHHSLNSSQSGSQMEIESGGSKQIYSSLGTPSEAVVRSQLSDRNSVHKGHPEAMPAHPQNMPPMTSESIEPCFDRRAMFALYCSKAAKNALVWSNQSLSLLSIDSSQRRLSETSTATTWLRAFKTMEQSIGSDTFRQFQNASNESLLSGNFSMIFEEDLQGRDCSTDYRKGTDGSDDGSLAAEIARIEPLPFKAMESA